MSRAKTLHIRIDEDEAVRLQMVADKHGMSISGVMRMLALREARQLSEWDEDLLSEFDEVGT